MEFKKLESLKDDLSENGIVRLWFDPNISNSEWKINGEFGKDCYSYFIIPAGFIFLNGNFWFEFNMKYQEVQIYYIKFYALYEIPRIISTLHTSKNTKLPYLTVPLDGRPNQLPENRFFIPINNEV